VPERTQAGAAAAHSPRMDYFFGAIVFLHLVVIGYSLFARRDAGISRHPYRNPYGDAPGAWSD
jgi:hypothetical protein